MELPEERSMEEDFAEFASAKDTPRDEASGEDPPQTAPEIEPDPEPSDPWESAPEELRNTYRQLEQERDTLRHRVQSDSGRVGGLQKKINELSAQLQHRPPEPSKAEVKEALATPEKWAEFSTEYPDIAEGIESRLQQSNGELEAIKKKLSIVDQLSQDMAPMREQSQQLAKQGQFAALDAAHPDWKTVAASPAFEAWKTQQHPAVQSLYDSDNADDASYLLSLFKQGQPKQVSPAPKKDLAAHVALPKRGAAPEVVPQDDADALFKHFAKQKEKKYRSY